MPRRKLTDEEREANRLAREQRTKEEINEQRKNKAEKDTKKFMGYVSDFLETKYGGSVPPELKCSILMLETYYRQFIQITDEITNLESLTTMSRYGVVPTPLLQAQSNIAVRLEKAMDVCGLTLKAQSKLEIAEVKESDSPLDVFLKSQNNDVEYR